ncbi:membrane protein, GtrA family [Clostridioides difficile]|uniref:Cell wall teichoic acid glycosylation protein n=3 Tax=Clostridioides difficile TaxID=1496 RepID=A0A9R0CFK0_CLODR|nr:GtrA family protein [Clostridioides difficile]OFU04492.1 teichoic acid glycosylation protein [Clostridium sp. HMSC19E03]OFU15608.1 teichoic acid glycosylation protein [Clostridium sp. HMSC19C09]OFU20951.1 teichoic acid glycosylation protein [Clostridium sp. HMSC19C08]OFU25654.1 teichoic acid glycosylation protein [Clostridium sp. HMSC19C05]OFU35192.1 teichoic acid glycosylation protein [Clostridium sp. HMSC19B10]OFU42389.1 teichoic acid glycosylation protein [Clostridium sp. HMSC19B01]
MILKKHRETILYLFFGAFTTLVNIVSYLFFTRVILFNFMVANALAWILAVLFAYVTNKFFVFESKRIEIRFVFKEFLSFVSFRLLSGVVEMLIMYVMIDLLFVNDVIVKIFTNIVVIVLNYLFSKMIIFKK